MEALEVIEKITMNIEAKRRERKEAGGKFFSQSIFDNGDIYDSLVNDDEHYESLFDKEVEIIKMGICFFLYSSLKRVKICLSIQALI